MTTLEISLDAFADRLTAAFPVMCKSMLRHEQNALTAGTMTLPQFWVLTWLDGRENATMHELAEAMMLKPSTATMLVDRLGRMKLISRQRDQEDRRRVRVRLTKAGRELVREIQAQKRKALRETFRHLDADERRRYLELIESLVQRLEKHNDNEPKERIA